MGLLSRRRERRRCQERLEQAEEIVWTMLVLMEVGGLDIPQEERDFIADAMDPWVEMATRDGILRDA